MTFSFRPKEKTLHIYGNAFYSHSRVLKAPSIISLNVVAGFESFQFYPPKFLIFANTRWVRGIRRGALIELAFHDEVIYIYRDICLLYI